jgi:toxin ParE1/3/4
MRVRWLEQASDDLARLVHFIENYNPLAAERLAGRIFDRAESLKTFPRRARARPDLGAGLRSVPIGSYLLVHSVTNEDVIIERVLHSARDLKIIFDTK